MARKTRAQWWKRLEEHGNANIAEYRRLTDENTELQRDLAGLRAQYGFPFADGIELARWMEEHPLAFEEARNALDALIQKHRIPRRWQDNLWFSLTIKWGGQSFSMGFPHAEISFMDGKKVTRFVVDSSTDLRNPLVQEYMAAECQSEEMPPRPQKMKGKRALDWRPVWEWSKRHPDVTRAEIARRLNYDRTTVSRKLEELDAELAPE